MNPRRSSEVAVALFGMIFLAGGLAASVARFGSAGLDNAAAAVPIEDRPAPSFTADVEFAASPKAAAMDNDTVPNATIANDTVNNDTVNNDTVNNADVANAEVATAADAVTGAAADTTPASDAPESMVEAALPNSSQVPPPEPPPVQVATANTPDPLPNDVKEAASSIEIVDECLVVDICVDRYLWALYQRTPKEDSIKVNEQRKVTVKRRGKTRTVTRSFTRLVDEDFAWKDPKAAEKAGMPMTDYVIGGMDRNFRLKLFHALHAAEEAGLSPGITSAFRDDYRQSIASGLKAATDRSYHGGSFRGGYGHGLAADVVSVKGATREQRWISTENLWKWIDAHGQEFGIGRPYLDKDPPHVAPVDGQEYAAHHRGTKAQHAESDRKKHNRLAVRDDHSVAKTPKKRKIVEDSKMRTI
jgi:hypothetical protein